MSMLQIPIQAALKLAACMELAHEGSGGAVAVGAHLLGGLQSLSVGALVPLHGVNLSAHTVPALAPSVTPPLTTAGCCTAVRCHLWGWDSCLRHVHSLPHVIHTCLCLLQAPWQLPVCPCHLTAYQLCFVLLVSFWQAHSAALKVPTGGPLTASFLLCAVGP